MDCRENKPPVNLLDDRHRWAPREVSPITVASMTIGSALSISLAADIVIRAIGGLEFIQPLFQMPSGVYLAGPLLIALSPVCEAISRTRVPPPVFRVKNDLTRMLIDLGILDGYDTRRWRGSYWVFPFGLYKRRTKSLSILFEVKSCRILDLIESERDMSFMFSGCQEMSIEQVDVFGIRKLFKMTLWYSSEFDEPRVFPKEVGR